MRIQVKSGQLGQVRGGVQVFAALEGERRAERLLPASSARDAALRRLVDAAGFRGAANETVLLPRYGRWPHHLSLGPKGRYSRSANIPSLAQRQVVGWEGGGVWPGSDTYPAS